MAANKDKTRAAAQKYLQKGQLDKAIREYQRLVEDDPKDVRTLLKIGDLQTRSGAHAKATETYSRVAQFYSDQGFFLKAVAVYKQILRLDSGLVEVNLKLADLYFQLGLMSDAATQYRQVSQIFEQEGRIDESIEILKKMVELDPDNVASRIKLAESYAKLEMTDDARAHFQAAADYLKGQHRIDDYVKVAERVIHFDPSDLETTRELADIYIQKNDPRRALAKLQVCFQKNPTDVKTLNLLAAAFKGLGQMAKTVSVYRELGRIHEANNDIEAQRSVMRKILALEPEDAEAQQALDSTESLPENALGRIRPTKKTVRRQSEVVEVNRTTTEDHRSEGSGPPPPPGEDDIGIEVELEDEESRRDEVATATQGNVEEAISRILIEADVYIKYGLKTKAIEHIRKVFALDTKHREARVRYKDLLVDTGEHDTAVSELMLLARNAADVDDAADAIGDLRELLRFDPSHAQARALLEELSPGESELNVEANEGDVVPTSQREMSSAEPSLSYEPSQAAAAINLDDDIESELTGPPPTPSLSFDALLGEEEDDEFSSAVTPAAIPAAVELADGLEDTSSDPGLNAASDEGRDEKRSVPDMPTESLLGEGVLELAEPELVDDFELVEEPDPASMALIDDQGLVDASEFDDLPDLPDADSDDELEDGDVDNAVPGPPPTGKDSDVSVHSGVSEVHFGRVRPARTTSEPADEKTESGETEIDFRRKHADPPPKVPEKSESTPAGLADLDALLASAVPSRRDGATAKAPPARAPREDSPPEALPPPEPDAPVVASGESYLEPRPTRELDDETADLADAGESEFDEVDLTDEIEEIAFFIEQSLEDEAREQLEALLAIYGSRPELVALQAQLDADQASSSRGSTANGQIPSTDEDEDIASVNLSTELAEELDELASGDDYQVAFQDVFEEFKKGVAEVVEEGDYQTHYDLGIAYKEMGLFNDAIREFEHAARSDDKAIGALTMMGLCALAIGDTAQALSHFLRGLNSDYVTAREALALRFEIGQAYEQMGRYREARKFFEKVDSIDPEFRGASERLASVISAIENNADASYNELDGELDELLVETEAERAARDKGDKISYI